MKAICPKCGQPGTQTITKTISGRYMVFNHTNKRYRHRVTGRMYTAPGARCFIGRSYTTDEAMGMMGLGGDTSAIAVTKSRRRTATPLQYKDGDKQCRKCGTPLIIGKTVTEHGIRVHNYICFSCMRERDRENRRSVNPRYFKCPKCGDMGRFNPYMSNGRMVYQMIHEKIGGTWGKSGLERRRRCYFHETSNGDSTIQTLLQQQA